MQHSDTPVLRDIVLIGGGHSHVMVLKKFAMQPLPGVRLTLICTDVHTPYSGMLPGLVAGHYALDDAHIDLWRLAALAGARLYHSEVTGLDRTHRFVLCDNRPPVAYDLVSINIGSTPAITKVPGAREHAIAVKPVSQFLPQWDALLERITHASVPCKIAVVGAGAGGVELLLAMQWRVNQALLALGLGTDRVQWHLFSNQPTILPTHNRRVQQRFCAVLQQRQVFVHTDTTITHVQPRQLNTHKGLVSDLDAIFWLTHAQAAAWLRDTGLALDERGFVRVNQHLQSLNDDHIFAAGDVASLEGHTREKAGVFAVRQGAILATNLRRRLQQRALTHYRPQSRWLALISTGDRFAVASRGHFSAAGQWVWQWKNYIDQRFMRQFSALQPIPQAMHPPDSTPIKLEAYEEAEVVSAKAMRCGGCGAKMGADILSRVLRQLKPSSSPDVLLGLADADDAAVVRVPAGHHLVHTVDFFRSMIDDPYLFGKIAANHALGDLWAMGAQPHTCTAIVTLPPGLQSKTESQLLDMMRGAIEVLNSAGCALIGGHTGEGKELALGFALQGLIHVDAPALLRKNGMQAGDVLLLTKPLGTGTLFAALPQGLAQGRWIDAALQTMLQSNQQAAHIAQAHGATACTDVTGFGLLGHLLEMARSAQRDAAINLDALPLLPGARACIARAVVSSLHASNQRAEHSIYNRIAYEQHPHYGIFFDPQTAGGLLLSIPSERASACLRQLKQSGYVQAAMIGRVLDSHYPLQPIHLHSNPSTMNHP